MRTAALVDGLSLVGLADLIVAGVSDLDNEKARDLLRLVWDDEHDRRRYPGARSRRTR